MRLAGASSGAYAYDLTSGRPLFALRADVPRPPASVEKLYTSVALLASLGPSMRLQTEVLGTGSPAPGGLWNGDLYLRGGGDPTFGSPAFNRVWEAGQGSTVSELVTQLVARDGIRRLSGEVIGDASRFDASVGVPSSHYAPDLADLGGELSALTFDHGASSSLTPGAYAAAQLASALTRAHVRAHASRQTAGTPRGARELAVVNSPTLAELLRLMNVPSDDFFAEMLTEQLGARFSGTGSIAAGARVITRAIDSTGVHPAIVNGSGLSREDHTTPLQVVTLLRSVSGTALGSVLAGSLPVVGVSGTVARIAGGTAAAGRCMAKTGTLDDVTNLAGYCRTGGGQRVAFAFFVDGPSNERGVALIGRMVADLAHLDPARP